MKDLEIQKTIAELDGWTDFVDSYFDGLPAGTPPDWSGMRYQTLKPYFTSRDAIIPVIRKVLTTSELKVKFLNALRSLVEARLKRAISDFDLLVESTECELCIALLKATEKWKE